LTLSVRRAPLFLQSFAILQSKKKFFVLGLSFSGLNVTSRGVFALFWPFCPVLGAVPMGHFWTQSLVENYVKPASIEPLIDFLDIGSEKYGSQTKN